jgi:hypothetical protein
MTLDELTTAVQADRFSWAVEGGPDGHYAAVVYPVEASDYIGDGLAGPGASYGETPVAALQLAWRKAIEERNRS